MSQHAHEKARVPFWRNPQIRAWIYQFIMLGGLLWVAFTMYQNTLANLEKRGIGSGFGFLQNEAGFNIGETPPLPVLQGGFLWFIAALIVGLFASRAIAVWLKKNDTTITASNKSVFAVITLVGIIPVLVLFLGSDSISFIRYTESSSYVTALLTGFANTIKVTILGCIFSTILGLFVALGRLSPNWLISKLCSWYVELNRNLPVLLQLFFWYFIVLQQLPSVRKSIDIGGWLILNKRGLYLPAPVAQSGAWPFCLAIGAALIGIYFIYRRSIRLLNERGTPGKIVLPSIALLVALPTLAWLTTGTPFTFEYPVLKGFNYRGGIDLTPEFTALLVGLTVYVSAFNAEIIRSGIQAVSNGQREAARALALKERHVMRLVILPQAMRIIVPPMTSEYLAIAKNSSLAVAIGYPDFVSVGGTILNQSGQAVEIVGIWMGVYLSISLLISLGMNWYNAKIKLVER
ncbi:ABC transporter permease subunit [Halodesulfovibrio sp.]|uniref:amino acid ABC transporter permease n=1 Tax=Halodesulfovibrio sp. TaxID=1912772 RepID=UPI0025BA579C|nr:ABC transporter permease subunit [Halodesulfovibrio sp.]